MEQGRDGTGTRVGWQLQEDSVRQLRDHLYWWVEAHPRASPPLSLSSKQWALEELAKMEDRLREKDAVKDMESMFDDIKEEGTQTKLMGTDKDKKTAAKAICDKVVADWVCNTMQSFNVTADLSFIEMIRDLVVQ